MARPQPTSDLGDPPVVKTLLLTDLVDSTAVVRRLGDRRAAALSERLDRVARDLLRAFDAREIDKTDGFLLLFDRPVDAVAYGLSHHEALAELSRELGVELQARVGIHLDEVLLRQNPAHDVERGAKPLEVEGLAKPAAARVMALARGRQTLLTRGAFDLARRAAVSGGELAGRRLGWLAHGPYRFQGLDEPLEIFEVGVVGVAPLFEPVASAKARRAVPAGDEITLGWRPAVGQEVPQRSHWVLADKLGEGGFGEVWLAAHRKTREHRVFKFCFEASRLRALRREVTLFRLLKEALGHRRDIARILDWNFDEAPYFLESEYTEAGDLADWAQQQGGIDRVPLPLRLELVAQVAVALDAAHSVGVLHKDVKPTNVLIEQDDDRRPRARLTDFGIGLLTDPAALSERGITALGMTEILSPSASGGAGTGIYMAPELLEGRPATVQSDVYALGVLLFQVVVSDLSHALASGWQREVDDELLREDIALCVDGPPERRARCALEIAERLRSLERRREAAGEQRRLREEAAAAQRALESAQRRRKIGSAIAIAAIAVTAVVSVLALQAKSAQQEAEGRRQQAEALIDFMLGDLREKLEPIGRLDILNDVGDKALEYFAAVDERHLTADEMYRRSRALGQLGQVRLREGSSEAALPAFEEALTIAERLVERQPDNAEWREQAGSLHFWIGSIHWNQGHLDGALERFRTQLGFAEGTLEQAPDNRQARENVAHAHTNIAFVQAARGDLEGALAAHRDSLEVFRQLVEENPAEASLGLQQAHRHSAIASILIRLGELRPGMEHFQEERRIVRALLVEEPANSSYLQQLVINYNYVTRTLLSWEEPSAAGREAVQALSLATELAAVDASQNRWQRSLAIARLNVAHHFRTQGQLDRAMEEAVAGLRVLEDLAASEPSSVGRRRDQASAHIRLAEVLEARGDLGRTYDNAEAAIEMLRPLVQRNPSDGVSCRRLSEAYLLKARALGSRGEEAQAVDIKHQAVEVIRPLAHNSRDLTLLKPFYEALLSVGDEQEAQLVENKLQTIRQRAQPSEEVGGQGDDV